MNAAIALLFLTQAFLAQATTPSIDQIRGDANLEHRAKAAVEFAAAAEKSAEANYARGDMAAVQADLKAMVEAVETARDALEQTGRPASRHPGPYKSAELKTQDILVRLNDLERRMDAEERAVVAAPRNRVQEIHDAWFDGIMSKKK